MSAGTSGLLRLGALALLWGSSYLWISLALRSFSPLQITLGRLLLGAGLLLVVVGAARVGPLLRDRSLWWPLLVAALLANVVPFGLFALAQQSISSGQAGSLNATTPLWALAVALLSRQQARTSTAQVVGLLTGLVGAVLVLQPWQDGAGSLVGSVWALLAAASYGVGYVFVAARLTSRGLHGTALAACQLVAGTLWLVPSLPWVLPGGPGAPAVWPQAVSVLALLLLGLGGTGLAYLLLYRIISDDGPVVAAGVAYLLPVVALLLGVTVLGETVSLVGVVGVVLVLLGVGLSRRRGGPSWWAARVGPRRRRPLTRSPRNVDGG